MAGSAVLILLRQTHQQVAFTKPMAEGWWTSSASSLPTLLSGDPLLQVMAVGLRVKAVAEDFGLSKETVYASHRESAAASILLTTEYAPKTKRVRLSQEDLDFAKAFMDEVFPQNSGRDFRVINMTDDTIYAVYFGFCTDRDMTPLGQTAFHDQILKKMKIHRSQDSTICSYCADLKKARVPAATLTGTDDQAPRVTPSSDALVRAGRLFQEEEEEEELSH
jgi:hypothetical protein